MSAQEWTPQDWTPEQIRNAMTYGVCRICRAPRETRITDETDENGYRTVTHGIVCPNGHPQ